MRVDKQEFVWEFSQLSCPGQTRARVPWELMRVDKRQFVWEPSELSCPGQARTSVAWESRDESLHEEKPKLYGWKIPMNFYKSFIPTLSHVKSWSSLAPFTALFTSKSKLGWNPPPGLTYCTQCKISIPAPGSCKPNWLQGTPYILNGQRVVLNFFINAFNPLYCSSVRPQNVATFVTRTIWPLFRAKVNFPPNRNSSSNSCRLFSVFVQFELKSESFLDNTQTNWAVSTAAKKLSETISRRIDRKDLSKGHVGLVYNSQQFKRSNSYTGALYMTP